MGSFYARVHITDVMSTTSVNARVYLTEPGEETMGAPVAQRFFTLEKDEDQDPETYLRDVLIALVEHI